MSKALELSNAFGFLKAEEVAWLAGIAITLIPENGTCINIGAGVGTSALTILELRPDLRKNFITVDVSPHSPIGGLQNERTSFENAGLKDRIPRQILGDSKVLGLDPQLIGIVADFIMVDGDHSRAGCEGDILAWKPHLKPGGIMMFHDYRPGVWQDVYDIVNIYMKDDQFLGQAGYLAAYRIAR